MYICIAYDLEQQHAVLTPTYRYTGTPDLPAARCSHRAREHIHTHSHTHTERSGVKSRNPAMRVELGCYRILIRVCCIRARRRKCMPVWV